jgi:hypothetical protein
VAQSRRRQGCAVKGMLAGRVTIRVALVLLCFAGVACSDSTGPPGDQPLVEIVFTATPLQLEHIAWIAPLGGLNPPAHTIPNDHIGLYHMNLGQCPCVYVSRPVFAPAGGTVRAITSSYDALEVGEPLTTRDSHLQPWYYIGHISLDPGIRVGDRVEAGQQIGTTSPSSPAIDFGLVHPKADNYFIVPARYHAKALYGDKPLRHYTEPLRTQLYALVRRTGTDKDGRFDYDIAGRLVGGWFHESLPRDLTSTGPEGWTRNLAFVYSDGDPSVSRIAVGGTLMTASLSYLDPNDPDFRSVGSATGLVRYHLYNSGPYSSTRSPDHLLLVQLVAEDRLIVEAFPGTAQPIAFTPNALVYLR